VVTVGYIFSAVLASFFHLPSYMNFSLSRIIDIYNVFGYHAGYLFTREDNRHDINNLCIRGPPPEKISIGL